MGVGDGVCVNPPSELLETRRSGRNGIHTTCLETAFSNYSASLVKHYPSGAPGNGLLKKQTKKKKQPQESPLFSRRPLGNFRYTYRKLQTCPNSCSGEMRT